MPLGADDIRSLIALQKHDRLIDAVEQSLSEIPAAIKSLKDRVEEIRRKAVQVRASAQELEKKKKEKELELAQKEEAARKHAGELNTVKTNEAFKALQLEIERSKAEAGEIETAVLEIMERMDAGRAAGLKILAEAADNEKVVQARIVAREAELAAAASEKDKLSAQRPALSDAVAEEVRRAYERIRARGKKDAVSSIEGRACGSCRMNLAPQVIVDATKLKNLVFCENCQSILYIPDVIEKAAGGKVG